MMLPRQLIVSVSIVFFHIFNLSFADAQDTPTVGEVRRSLTVAEEYQKKADAARKLLEENIKKVERYNLMAQAEWGRKKDVYWNKAAELSLEQATLKENLDAAEKNAVKAWSSYRRKIGWYTNLYRDAVNVYLGIQKMNVNESNKRRAMAAISDGIQAMKSVLVINDFSELNKELLNNNDIRTTKIVIEAIRFGRPLEWIKEKVQASIKKDEDRVVADVLIGSINDAIQKKLGEKELLNRIDSKLGAITKAVKLLRIFEESAAASDSLEVENIHRLADMLDLISDLVPGQYLPAAAYIKVQHILVQQIAELAAKVKLAHASKNLQLLHNQVYRSGSDRIKGTRIKWDGLVTDCLFGAIPPEPQLTTEKKVFAPGESIVVNYEGSHNWSSPGPTAGWIGLIPSNIEHGSSDLNDKEDLEYYYMRKEFGVLTFTAPEKTGSYDLRMFDSDPGMFEGDGKEQAFISIKVVFKVVFSENFERGLSQWTGKDGGAHHARIVPDPLQGDRALAFTKLNEGGDIFSRPIPSGRYTLSFDYLGLPQLGGVRGNLGGFIGYSISDSHVWLGGTGSGYDDLLPDTGKWERVTIKFEVNQPFRLMLEDYEKSEGVPGDALFDNIIIKGRPAAE